MAHRQVFSIWINHTCVADTIRFYRMSGTFAIMQSSTFDYHKVSRASLTRLQDVLRRYTHSRPNLQPHMALHGYIVDRPLEDQ